MQCLEVWGGNRATDSAFEMPGLKVSVYSQPYGHADGGGDVYYLSSCASGRVTRVLLADVSGHGSKAADTALSLRELMRRNINYVDQRRLAAGVNAEFGQMSTQGRFATALVGTYFSPTRTLTLCRAGHPPPLLYRAKSGTWSIHEPRATVRQGGHNLPFGVTDTNQFDHFATKLQSGDLLLCYTDAVSEVRVGSSILGTNGLLSVVENLDPTRPASLISNLLSRLSEFSDEQLDHDDATLILVEATGSGVPVRNTLTAPFRLLHSWLRR
jgi:phosphoserine phosphatase RsbU/P